MRPLPDVVARWRSGARALRWLDGLVAWLWLWAGSAMLLGEEVGGFTSAGLGALFLGVGVLVPTLRARWRPVSGPVGLAVSRGLRPGDRAWYVRPGEAEPVLVTAVRGVFVVVARPGEGGAEGISVRRTRVVLLRAEPP